MNIPLLPLTEHEHDFGMVAALKKIAHGDVAYMPKNEQIDARYFYHAFILNGKLVSSPANAFINNAHDLVTAMGQSMEFAIKLTKLLRDIEKKVEATKTYDEAVNILKGFAPVLARENVAFKQHEIHGVKRYLGDIELIAKTSRGAEFTVVYDNISPANLDKSNSSKHGLKMSPLMAQDLSKFIAALISIYDMREKYSHLEDDETKIYRGRVQFRDLDRFDTIFKQWVESGDPLAQDVSPFFHEDNEMMGYEFGYGGDMFKYGCRYLAASFKQ